MLETKLIVCVSIFLLFVAFYFNKTIVISVFFGGRHYSISFVPAKKYCDIDERLML